MKKVFLLISSLFLMHTGTSWAQIENDTIQITRSSSARQGGGTHFILDGKRLSPRQLVLITRINPVANQQMKIANSKHDFGQVLGFVGGYLVGYQAGRLIVGGQFKWGWVGTGAGLAGLSIPFSLGYTKYATKAVQLYNAGLQAEQRPAVNVKVGVALNQVGVTATF